MAEILAMTVSGHVITRGLPSDKN